MTDEEWKGKGRRGGHRGRKKKLFPKPNTGNPTLNPTP